MAVPSKPTIAANGTNTWSDGTIVTGADLQAYFDPLYNGFTGLDDTNVNPGSPSVAVQAVKIAGISANAAAQQLIVDPGSGGSLNSQATLDLELETIRYAIERITFGLTGTTHAVRYNGANVSIGWMDYPHRFGNLIYNGRFAVKTTNATSAPDGWTLSGVLTNCALVAGVATEGAGKILNLTNAAGPAGITQTLAGLKASTRYLFVVRTRANTGTSKVTVTGADSSSQFQPITVTTTSATFTSLKFVVQTDATPTALVLSILSVANGDNIDVSYVSCHECSIEALYPVDRISVRTTDTTQHAALFPTNTVHQTNFCAPQLSTAVIVPGPGYAIRVRTKIDILGTSAYFVCQLTRNGTPVDAWRQSIGTLTGSIISACPSDLFVNPVPGTTYTYAIIGGSFGSACDMNNTALWLNETPSSYLDLELVKL